MKKRLERGFNPARVTLVSGLWVARDSALIWLQIYLIHFIFQTYLNPQLFLQPCFKVPQAALWKSTLAYGAKLCFGKESASCDLAEENKIIMKQGSNQRRPRGRNNNNNNNGGGARRGNRNSSQESNGPEVKVRGSAQQILDKYIQLARDAQSSNDRVKAEAYLQYAEHYFRVVNADQEAQAEQAAKRAEQNANRAPDREDDQNAEKKGEGREPRRGRRPRNPRNAPKNEATLAAEAAAANEAAAGSSKKEAVVEDVAAPVDDTTAVGE